MDRRAFAPALMLLATALCSCGDDRSDEAQAAAGGGGGSGVTDVPTAGAGDPGARPSSANVGVAFPNGSPYAGQPTHVVITIQGAGSFSSNTCQSPSGAVTGTYDQVAVTDGGGRARVALSARQASWQAGSCSVPAGAAGPVNVHFDFVTAIAALCEVAVSPAACSSYCAGGARGPTCESHCRTFRLIRASVPLSPAEVARYQSTGELSPTLYLNELQ